MRGKASPLTPLRGEGNRLGGGELRVESVEFRVSHLPFSHLRFTIYCLESGDKGLEAIESLELRVERQFVKVIGYCYRL